MFPIILFLQINSVILAKCKSGLKAMEKTCQSSLLFVLTNAWNLNKCPGEYSFMLWRKLKKVNKWDTKQLLWNIHFVSLVNLCRGPPAWWKDISTGRTCMFKSAAHRLFYMGEFVLVLAVRNSHSTTYYSQPELPSLASTWSFLKPQVIGCNGTHTYLIFFLLPIYTAFMNEA